MNSKINEYIFLLATGKLHCGLSPSVMYLKLFTVFNIWLLLLLFPQGLHGCRLEAQLALQCKSTLEASCSNQLCLIISSNNNVRSPATSRSVTAIDGMGYRLKLKWKSNGWFSPFRHYSVDADKG